MRITDEQKERANLVNLPQFLMSHGFDLKKVGKEYVWKEHDSLHIKDNGPGERGQWFRFSENKGGDNIGLLREYMDMSFIDAVEALTGELIDRTYTPSRTYELKPVQQTAMELSLAEADNCRRVFAYLCKTRGLDYDMLSALVKKGTISQEEKTGNVLFKYYDDRGKVIGAEKVGTSTEHKFKGIATGSAGGHGFEVVHGTGEKAFFFESAIDMLSYLQMHSKKLDNCRLVSMMGVKPNIVLDTMLRHNIAPENVFLCSDNDTAGNEFARRLQEQYPDMKRIITPDTYKDWNDMLRDIPKQIEVEQETKTKEVNSVADIITYGNKMWNNATDNRDKSLISMQLADFQRVQEMLEKSGINYYAYEMNSTFRMAVNDKDTDWLRKILGNMNVTKSNRPYSPPEKNIIGNTEYRYIPQKEYVTADRDLVLKMADIMVRRGMQFSGRIYPSGKGTLTVSHADFVAVRNIKDEVISMRKQFASPNKAQEVGNRDYCANRDTRYYMSKLTPEQFKEVKPFLETSVSYHAVSREGKVAFAVDKENAPAFHRALENAVREVGMLRNMADLGLTMEQNVALSRVVHRLAVEDMKLDLADFFDSRYDEAQFGEMLSLVNAYIAQTPAERYGENSKLTDMLEAKSSFDRSMELSDFFSQHDFSDEQRAAITAMFVGYVTRGQIDSIDETFTAEDIQAYDEILHNALQESDVADFLTAHKQTVIDRENANRIPTEEEVLFPKADLARFLAEHTLSSDDWESMAYPLFERGYLEKHQPSDNSSFGYHLPEKELYALAERYYQGDDIRREFALGLMIHASDNIADKDRIEFVFEDGKISDRTYYYAENLRHSLHLERTDDGYNCSFGGMERFVSLEEIGQAFLDRTHEEFNDLAFWWVRDDMLDAIPDISDEKIADLLTAFDGAALHGWEAGDNQPKLNRIKKALHDILGDEVQTENAFAIIAKEKYNVTFEPERKPDSLEFQFGYSKDGNDRWFTESGLLSDFAEEHGEISFAFANALMEYLDDKQHKERMIPDLNAGYYKKTNFDIRAVVDGQEFNFSNRFDIGDGKGSGGGSLIDHIRTICENAVASTNYPYNTPESKETPRNMLNVLVPYLESHSALTAEEQKILDDFKEKNPIRTIDDVEKAQGKFQIYQLPGGEKYHGVRFEGLDRLKAEGVQLNKDDYELVYEGIVGEFRGNATIEGIFTQFNTKHPEDFRGHSLSVSDVIVISMDDKDTAYYCDSFGFTEMPEFFLEKERTQEKSAPSVADLAVGDIIMYDGARREVEKISEKSISMKDLDAPDYGGILLGTSDVLAYDGWQQDMEEKGFEILSKAEKSAVDSPEKAEPEDKGSVSLRKVGDFYEMYGKNAEIGAEVLGLRMLSKNGSPMVGFPNHVKDEYSAKLREAGYTVLIEQAFELNPPKREAEKLQTLQQVVDKFFGTDCESAETEGGTWKLAITDGEKVGELFYGGEPVCGIYNRGDKMEIEPYRELSTFSKLLQTAMLEHNPDKPVEIMDFQRIFETPLDKAKWLINDFCEAEYHNGADFSDLHNIGLAFTTLTDDELPIQVTADLVDFKITHEFDGEVFDTEQFDSIEDMIENGLTELDFSDLVSVPDEVIDRHTSKAEQAVELMSDASAVETPAQDTADIDKPLFTDETVIDEIQRNEQDDVPFWEKHDIEGEQLSLFGDAEPLTASKSVSQKPKSEFAKGPVVDSVQVYEALAAEIDRGTGFVHGKLRVQDFYEEQHPTVQQLADFLKKEYGTGGHSGEGKISLVDYNSQGITFSFENGEKFRHSWYNVATMTEARLKDDTYLSAEQKAERATLKAEQSAEERTSHDTVEVGDQFRHKITGEVSEVVSLTGALPFYTDDCTVSRESGGFVITENISYDKLLNSGMYEYIGRTEPEREQPAPVAEVTPETEKPDIPDVKNLSQLKRAIKPGMMFEISDHLRPECVGERRIVTGVSTVDFTSRKLDENGEPAGKDIHMEFDRAKNWTFDGGELTSRLDNGDMLMSFHFIDGLERTKESERETIAEEAVSADEPVAEESITPAPTPDKGDNFTITDDNLGDGGAKTKFRANVDAIGTLKTIEREKRPATAEEKETLSKYVGWGALAKAFDKNDEKWATEYKELSELLTPQEYAQARSTVNDAFYTSPTVIDGVFEALGNFGFDGGNILEPAMGIGNFFGRMPEAMQANSQLYGVEIDSLSGRIAQALYPDADIAIQGFEKNRFQNGSFDVAVGNVPFGELGFREENPIKVHPNIIYSTFCGSRMFLFSVSPLSRNL
ncbi:YodL domain-containing protein [Ruminococcus bicirculans (ex Wegman et al. 2014)]|uniref:YodL domain-containing protein n=1 Tax=Ruminococcus bicirculans (ex Wegman et al. 2014) TaxID=1160721 RepID=UPI00399A64B8